jgi:hypothetical protein
MSKKQENYMSSVNITDSSKKPSPKQQNELIAQKNLAEGECVVTKKSKKKKIKPPTWSSIVSNGTFPIKTDTTSIKTNSTTIPDFNIKQTPSPVEISKYKDDYEYCGNDDYDCSYGCSYNYIGDIEKNLAAMMQSFMMIMMMNGIMMNGPMNTVHLA